MLSGHTDKVWHADFSPDGRRIVTASVDGTARLWDTEGKQVAVLEGDMKTVRSAVFSPDGNRIVAVADSDDHGVPVWDRDGNPVTVLEGHTSWIRYAGFSADSRRIVTTSHDGTARLWYRSGGPIHVLVGHTKSVENASFSPDGRHTVTASLDGTVRVWSHDGTQVAVLEGHEDVLHAMFSPAGNRIVTIGDSDHAARLWNSEWKQIAVLAGHTSFVRAAAFSPDGSRIVTASLDHTARLWDSEGKPLTVLRGHTAEVRHVAFSRDGSSIVTASDDRTARLWDSEGKRLAVLEGHAGRLTYAAFSRDGSRIVTTAEDGIARLYRVPATTHNSSTASAAADVPNGLRFERAVRAIFEDSRGHFWFGTWKDGVCRFDGERYTYFTLEDSLANNQVRTILEDRNGVIWFQCGFGISSYDGERIITHTSRDYTSKDDWRLEAGDLWFTRDEGYGIKNLEGVPGVYRYDGDEFIFLSFPVKEDPQNDWDYGVTGIAKGKSGRLWFATWGAVVGYDGESFTIINDESLGLNADTGFLHGRCVFEDSKGRVWYGNNGIGVLLLEGDTITNFTQANGVGRRDHRSGGSTTTPQPGDAPEGAPSLHRVFAIGEDRAGNIWFGTAAQGAWRYDGESLRNFTEEDGLASKGITAIYMDRRGDLWLGGNGVYKFNGESFDRIH